MPEATDPSLSETERRLPPARGDGAVLQGNGGRRSEPEAMRREIEQTRARMSRTLDELEESLLHQKQELVRKRDELWAKATLRGVRRKLSREPWRSMAIAFAVGYVVAAIRD